MATVRYTKADWIAQVDIQALDDGKFQGVVVIAHKSGSVCDESQHIADTISDTPKDALDEAKALAHRILDDL
jgi:hypothetical protein